MVCVLNECLNIDDNIIDLIANYGIGYIIKCCNDLHYCQNDIIFDNKMYFHLCIESIKKLKVICNKYQNNLTYNWDIVLKIYNLGLIGTLFF